MTHQQYSATVLADSMNPVGERITTIQIRMPLCVWAEFLTHRSFARNARSNRAVPSRIVIGEVIRNPFVPHCWGRNQRGMQAATQLSRLRSALCRQIWLLARWPAIAAAYALTLLGLHKQDANRLLAPWQWVDAVVTGNDWAWGNFDELRRHPEADPKIQRIAELIFEARSQSHWEMLGWGQWHLPYYSHLPKSERGMKLAWAAAGACARVSYAAFDGSHSDDANAELAKRLGEAKPGHLSPFEHCVVAHVDSYGSNLQCIRGAWRTFRKLAFE